MQVEVGEAAEPGGGSSTMPHKRNPSGSAIALAAAYRVPTLVASFLSGMVQEHERGVGGIQAEWPTVAAAVQATGAAAAAMAGAVGGLTVNGTRMRANLDATHGVVFAERLSMFLAGRTDRTSGHALLAQAARESAATGRMFADVVRGTPAIADLLSPEELRDFDLPEDYLGSAEELRRRLLEEQ
jgi:3-carboxy-cis,cis-muconate cycloisomerase